MRSSSLPGSPLTPPPKGISGFFSNPLSTPPSSPWGAATRRDPHSSSPVQHAISSCMSHLESLIRTREPSDEETVYLVTKFKELARYSHSSSPAQHALSSCISHLENLIQTREPNDEQMEFLVTKFEEIARFLSAPEAQSKRTDDHLFAELEGSFGVAGLGLFKTEGTNLEASDIALSQGYVLKVGQYIENVQTHIKDMTMRMDEVKQLNSIQLDIIKDLRQEIENKSTLLKKEREKSAKRQKNVKIMPPERNSFWFAIGEALDFVGAMLHEW